MRVVLKAEGPRKGAGGPGKKRARENPRQKSIGIRLPEPAAEGEEEVRKGHLRLQLRIGRAAPEVPRAARAEAQKVGRKHRKEPRKKNGRCESNVNEAALPYLQFSVGIYRGIHLTALSVKDSKDSQE